MKEEIIKIIGAVNKDIDVKDELKIKVSSLEMLEHEGISFYNCESLYYAYYEDIPNVILFRGIIRHPEKVMKWIEQNYKELILKKLYLQRYSLKFKRMKFPDAIYFLKDKLIIDVSEEKDVVILFTDESEELAQAIGEQMKQFTHEERNKIHFYNMLIQKGSSIELIELENIKPKMTVEKNYNEDLVELNKKIVKSLNTDSASGLFLFHGAPGTGKSTYIRYLINSTNKKVIFMTPKLAGNLDTPQLLNLLLENPYSILVIEDAEDLLQSRDTGTNPYISMLLNITDGLLGSNLGLKIICTFNGNFNKIDNALLRKGRLIAKYEFKALSIIKAQSLSNSLGFKTTITKEMTLADIYNQEKEDFGGKGNRKRIGF